MLGPIVSLGLPNPITLGHRTGVAHDLFSDVIGRLGGKVTIYMSPSPRVLTLSRDSRR